MLDFAAYLERVGLRVSERPTLQAIHHAHATSIPFENLDPHRGIPISLAQNLILGAPTGASLLESRCSRSMASKVSRSILSS
jgi:hypothetical protein